MTSQIWWFLLYVWTITSKLWSPVFLSIIFTTVLLVILKWFIVIVAWPKMCLTNAWVCQCLRTGNEWGYTTCKLIRLYIWFFVNMFKKRRILLVFKHIFKKAILLVYNYKFYNYIPNCCLFAGTDKERLCVSKIRLKISVYVLTSLPTVKKIFDWSFLQERLIWLAVWFGDCSMVTWKNN